MTEVSDNISKGSGKEMENDGVITVGGDKGGFLLGKEGITVRGEMKKVVVAAGFKVERVCVEAGSMVIQEECLEGPNIKSEARVGLAESGGGQGEYVEYIKLEDNIKSEVKAKLAEPGGVQGEQLVVAGIKLEDKRSTVPFLQRQLNIDNNKRKIELKRLQFVGDQKRKYCYLNFFVRVNYVFFLDLENKAYFTFTLPRIHINALSQGKGSHKKK